MNRVYFFNILILLIFFSSIAEAKKNEYWWERAWYGHHDPDFAQPYLENQRHAQNPQWYGQEWYAEEWLVQYQNDLDLIDQFYRADIFRGQETTVEGIPVLIVGPNFYHLSGFDKRRVTHVLDVVYNITSGTGVDAFVIEDWATKRQIGVYTKHGLQLH